MSVLASVEKRLEESEQRLSELIQHLERHNSLEESLDDAGRGIGEATSNLGELAASTKAALESLRSMVDSLQETVGILGRSNPAETVEAVARVEKELESAGQETRNVIVNELEATRQETGQVIVKELEATRQETKNVIVKELEITREQNKQAIDEVSNQVSAAKVDIGAAVQGGSAETVSKIEAALERISGQQSDSQNRAALISYITLTLVMVVVGLEALRFFL